MSKSSFGLPATIKKQQKLGDDIQALKLKISELDKTLIEMEMEFELMDRRRKGLKKYRISWTKYYHASGEKKIEASTEEEAIQIVKDHVGEYDGSLDWGPDSPFIESLGEVDDH